MNNHTLILIVTVLCITALHTQEPIKPVMPVDGHSSDWVKRTASIRAELERLDPQNKPVQPYLPRIAERIKWVTSITKFSWKNVPALDMLQGILEDLNNDIVPYTRYSGRGIPVTYWSEHMQRLEAVWVQVPPDYSPQKSYQLCVYYKSGGGIHYKKGKAAGGYRPSVEMANKDPRSFHIWSSLHVQCKGRQGIEEELMELIPVLCGDFSIDPDRVFLSGYSDGGFSALWIASRHPHLVAGIFPMVANWQYANSGDFGLQNIPMLIVDGWGDGGYLKKNLARFQTIGTHSPVSAILGHHGHDYKAFENEDSFLKIMEWCTQQKRNPYPRTITYATWGLSWNRAYWLTIDRMADPRLGAWFEAEVHGNTIEVTAHNIAQYTLSLSDKLIHDTDHPITVKTNGAVSFTGPYNEQITIQAVSLPETPLQKTHKNPGGIQTHMKMTMWGSGDNYKVPGRRWMWVRPTGCSEAETKLLPKAYTKWGTADTALTVKQMAANHLFCYGNPRMNKFIAKIADKLPVTFTDNAFTVYGKTYDQPEQCIKFIHPNPLNPDKMIIVYAFNNMTAAKALNSKQVNSAFFKGEDSWGFRTGDCVVYTNKHNTDEPFDVYIFDSNWQAPPSPVLARAAAPVSAEAVLKLKAEAVKAAAGVQFGIINNAPPGYAAWHKTLPAGDITLNELAMLGKFPEYIITAEISGAELLEFHNYAKGSTLKAPNSIKPGQTYTVAFDYLSSSHSFLMPRFDKSRLAQPFIFCEDLDSFLNTDGISPRVHNAKLTRIQLIEALAEYIQNKQTIKPE